MDKDAVLSEDDTTNAVNLSVLMDDMVTEAYLRVDVITSSLRALDARLQKLDETFTKLREIMIDARNMRAHLQNELTVLERTIDQNIQGPEEDEVSDEHQGAK